MILDAQELALRTNVIKQNIDQKHWSETSLCRMCGDTTETVGHIASRCKKLAQNEYHKRHDKVALRVHWEICRKHGIDCSNKWYEHQPSLVVENDEVRIRWDMTIYTDKKLKHNRPDITVMQRNTKEWTLIDIAVPAVKNVSKTEQEKVEKYQDLAFEMKRCHGASKVSVVPIIVEALGITIKSTRTWHRQIELPVVIGSVQLAAVLGTAHILRKVLGL